MPSDQDLPEFRVIREDDQHSTVVCEACFRVFAAQADYDEVTRGIGRAILHRCPARESNGTAEPPT